MNGRRPIRVMPADLARTIAAGEVVERPASAVKELLDNAVDAGARQIGIEIREAGLKLIRVTDDGAGIPRDELRLAFTSHATNKIETLDDLERLTTLGFRGEALPSIAAVARVEVQTRAAEETVGTRHIVEFGEERGAGPCAAPPGTRVAVADLFANVPARRKFVRSLRAEGGQIQSVVMQYALAQPDIRFTLTVDGRVTFRSPGTGRLTDAVAAVHGPDVPAEMVSLDAEESGVTIWGLVSRLSLTRPNRAGISIFVNGRTVNNRSLSFALEEAYSGFLMTGRHPLAAVHLVLTPGEIDANVHPSKSEVRFAREREVHGILYRAVANALLELRLRETGTGVEIGPDALEASAEAEQRPLLDAPSPEGGGNEVAAPGATLPALRVFGQANAMFIIAEGPAGLYMIDQHAAHERVLYDLFDAQLEDGGVPTQPLLEPISLDLTPAQMLALEENRSLLADAGFVLEPFGTEACLVRALPALAVRGSPSELVYEVLDELQSSPQASSARERALAAMACKAAVKAGSTLGVGEMRELVAQLERTLRPATCPHGRPTMIHLSHSQLQREFGRR